MKNPRCLSLVLCLVVIAFVQLSVLGQTMEEKGKLAAITSGGSSVRWEMAAPFSVLTMTISAPDGRVFRKEFKGGAAPEFMITDDQGERLPDGQYTYELRLTPIFAAGVKESLATARGSDDEPEDVRASRKRGLQAAQSLVQSGGFSILNGAIIVAGAVEASEPRGTSKLTGQSRFSGFNFGTALMRNRRHHPRLIRFDDVIPDDLIVQGSACVGLDCVNGEVFGFDTIRVKENNTRIQFDDTSGAGFATNNWQIRANGSGGGAASFLAFVDQGATGNSESGTIVFEVDAGAAANSLRVSSTSRVGLRTATPVLDLHINTSDTPAHRLEQNSSGGFSAQTWDIAGNEANFFVRDVTSGSRLPFRIRPGAPTSSVDIAASGNVGIGTAGPSLRLEAFGVGGLPATSGTAPTGIARFSQSGGAGVVDFGFGGAAGFGWVQATSSASLATNFGFLINPNGGNVGIGTTAPTDTLSVNGTASKPGGGSWAVFSDERLKTIKGQFNSGLKAVMRLQPLRYVYNQNNALGLNSTGEHVGFGAQSLQLVIPEAVTETDNGYLQVNNDPIIWTMLNAIKEQQKEIEQLRREVRQLRTASRKRR